jgi:hypothetical protein
LSAVSETHSRKLDILARSSPFLAIALPPVKPSRLILGADIERARRVLVRRDLAHAAQILGHLPLDRIPTTLAAKPDAPVHIAPEHVATVWIIRLEPYK